MSCSGVSVNKEASTENFTSLNKAFKHKEYFDNNTFKALEKSEACKCAFEVIEMNV